METKTAPVGDYNSRGGRKSDNLRNKERHAYNGTRRVPEERKTRASKRKRLWNMSSRTCLDPGGEKTGAIPFWQRNIKGMGEGMETGAKKA